MEFVEYISKQGDRWDTIALKAYGDSTLVNGIIEANTSIVISPVLEAGTRLVIPILENAEIQIDSELLLIPIFASLAIEAAFLKRISSDYGVVFSVRESIITFTSIYDLHKRNGSFVVDKTDLKSYSIKDKSADGVSSVKVKHTNAKKNEKVEVNLEYEKWVKEEGSKYPDIVNKDTKVISKRTENKQQAEAKAKAAMHLSATNQFEGRISMQGNNLALAGNNFQLTGIGILSGKYNIKSSSHKLDRSGGHSVDLEIKRLQSPSKKDQITVKKKKVQPKNVKVESAKIVRRDYVGKFGKFDRG